MKNLFRRILGSTPGKGSQTATWIVELAEMDSLSALKLSTQKITQLIDDETLTTNQKLDIIIETEEVNQPHLEKLSSQFANLSNINPTLENSISETCYSYSRQSYIYHLKNYRTSY